MKYNVTMVKKSLYEFTVEASCEEDAIMEAYHCYEVAVDEGTIQDYFSDSDVLIDDIGVVDED